MTAPAEVLTRHQLRIFTLVGQGLSSREIAEHLNVSLRTIDNHRAHICRRLGLNGSHALLREAVRFSIAGSPPDM
jgi:DNA-binding CsgD family transcriptional regulator